MELERVKTFGIDGAVSMIHENFCPWVIEEVLCAGLAIEATGAPSAGLGLADYVASSGKGSYFGVCPTDAKTEVSPLGDPDCCKPHCATLE